MDLYQKKSMYQNALVKLNNINTKNKYLLTKLKDLKSIASETLIEDDKIYKEDDINYVINSIYSTVSVLSDIVIPNLGKEITSLDSCIKNYEESLRQQSQINNITPTTVNTNKNNNTTVKTATYSNYSR